ncbi:MAG: hypothetical protein AVDCRST_MAG93-821, partial [uncultured Chloroflexia bacterium]
CDKKPKRQSGRHPWTRQQSTSFWRQLTQSALGRTRLFVPVQRQSGGCNSTASG